MNKPKIGIIIIRGHQGQARCDRACDDKIWNTRIHFLLLAKEIRTIFVVLLGYASAFTPTFLSGN